MEKNNKTAEEILKNELSERLREIEALRKVLADNKRIHENELADKDERIKQLEGLLKQVLVEPVPFELRKEILSALSGEAVVSKDQERIENLLDEAQITERYLKFLDESFTWLRSYSKDANIQQWIVNQYELLEPRIKNNKKALNL